MRLRCTEGVNLNPNAKEFVPREGSEIHRSESLMQSDEQADASLIKTETYFYGSILASGQPSRAILIELLPYDVDTDRLISIAERWGDVRYAKVTQDPAQVHLGVAEVHYYDVRHAEAALKDIQAGNVLHQHYVNVLKDVQSSEYLASQGVDGCRPQEHRQALAAVEKEMQAAKGLINGQAVWAVYVPPCCYGADEMDNMNNQGTLVVFNLDADIDYNTLKATFQRFGDVRDIRESPAKRTHRFVEFADVRHAERAMRELDGTEIGGNVVKIEFSRPGGTRKHEHHKHGAGHTYTKTVPFTHAVVYYYGSYLFIPWPMLRSSKEEYPTTPEEYPTPPAVVKEVDYEFKEQGDHRTTLMLKNIPNKYTQEMLVEKIERHCRKCNADVKDPNEVSAFDFLYMPIDFRNRCNLGYAFVNFTTVAATVKFYKAFKNFQWEKHNTRKICDIAYAKIQGREKLEEHFRKGTGQGGSETDYGPYLFNPPKGY